MFGVPGVKGSGGAAKAAELVVSMGVVPSTVPAIQVLTVVVMRDAAVCDASQDAAIRCGGQELPAGCWRGKRVGTLPETLPLAVREQMNHSVFYIYIFLRNIYKRMKNFPVFLNEGCCEQPIVPKIRPNLTLQKFNIEINQKPKIFFYQ